MTQIKEFDLVTIYAAPSSTGAGRPAFDCHVLAIVGRAVALFVDDPVAAGRMPTMLPDVYLSHQHGARIVALRGSLVAVGAGELRFTAHESEPLARRGASRIAAELRLQLRAPEGLVLEGTTRDLSAHGAYVAIEEGLEGIEENQVLEAALFLEDSDPLVASVRVVRLEPGHVALQYLAGSTAMRRGAGRHVIDCNRAHLMRRRATAPAAREAGSEPAQPARAGHGADAP